MHSAPGLVCSDRPEGRLLSRFDPSVTQTVSTVYVRRSGMAVQGPPLRALPVSPCVHEGCRGRPYPVTGSRHQDPQLPRRLAYPSPIQGAVGRSQGLGAPAPQPVGASGQLGKEQALPCAENLFSRCGVRLGEYDGTPHEGTCPSSAELKFLQRQKCGTTETVSEAPGAYGIRSCSHAARIATYETTSALATLPRRGPGMISLVRDVRGFQVNPLCCHNITSPFPPSGNGGYVRNLDIILALSTFSYNVRLCITTDACILVQSHVSGLDIRTARRHKASIKDTRDCWRNSHALCEKFSHLHAHLKRLSTRTSEALTHTHLKRLRTHI